MTGIYQLLACVTVILAAYIFFQGFGRRGENFSLLYSRTQKNTWDARLRASVGSALILTSIFGTLTSFPTTIFLFSGTKAFGWFSSSVCVTIFLGAWVTNFFTVPIRHHPRIRDLLSNNDQVSGVICSLFWGPETYKKQMSSTIRFISLVCTLALLWLDFFAFTTVTTAFYNVVSVPAQALLFCLAAFTVIFFVLLCGIRGFVYADLCLVPLIGGSAIIILTSVIAISAPGMQGVTFQELTAPVIVGGPPGFPYLIGILFSAHVLILNSLQVLCSEPHWLRVWLLGDKEITLQRTGTALTGLGWLVMLPIGFFAYFMMPEPEVGDVALINLLHKLEGASPLLIFFFWLLGAGAVFASADIQIYSALLVYQYDTKTGRIRDIPMTANRALWSAAFVSLVFALTYTFVRSIGFNFEAYLFAIVPACTTLFPPFFHCWLGRESHAWVIVISALGYGMVSGWGVLTSNMYGSLSAIFIPVIVSIVTYPFMQRLEERG